MPALPGACTQAFRDLVAGLLTKDPLLRMSWAQLCTQPFLPQPLEPLALPPQPAMEVYAAARAAAAAAEAAAAAAAAAVAKDQAAATPARRSDAPAAAGSGGTLSGGSLSPAAAAAGRSPGDIALMRLSHIARSNLQRDGSADHHGARAASNGDIALANADAELDFGATAASGGSQEDPEDADEEAGEGGDSSDGGQAPSDSSVASTPRGFPADDGEGGQAAMGEPPGRWSSRPVAAAAPAEATKGAAAAGVKDAGKDRDGVGDKPPPLPEKPALLKKVMAEAAAASKTAAAAEAAAAAAPPMEINAVGVVPVPKSPAARAGMLSPAGRRPAPPAAPAPAGDAGKPIRVISPSPHSRAARARTNSGADASQAVPPGAAALGRPLAGAAPLPGFSVLLPIVMPPSAALDAAVAEALWHPSDSMVKPIVHNRRIEPIPEVRVDVAALPFKPWTVGDLLTAAQPELEGFLTSVYRSLQARLPPDPPRLALAPFT